VPVGAVTTGRGTLVSGRGRVKTRSVIWRNRAETRLRTLLCLVTVSAAIA